MYTWDRGCICWVLAARVSDFLLPYKRSMADAGRRRVAAFTFAAPGEACAMCPFSLCVSYARPAAAKWPWSKWIEEESICGRNRGAAADAARHVLYGYVYCVYAGETILAVAAFILLPPLPFHVQGWWWACMQVLYMKTRRFLPDDRQTDWLTWWVVVFVNLVTRPFQPTR